MSLPIKILNSEIYMWNYFQSEDVCRLCWSKDAHRILTVESSEINEGMKNLLAEKIEDCLSLDLSIERGPKKVCSKCCDLVEKFYDFKRFCSEADKKLCDILSKKEYESPYDVPEQCFNENDQKFKVESVSSDMEPSENEVDNKSPDNISERSFDVKLKVEAVDSDTEPSENATIENSQVCQNQTSVNKEKNSKPKTKFIREPTFCHICSKDYETIDKFTKHNSDLHGIESNGEFRCFGCSKRFKSRKNRLHHEISSCKELKDGYKCNICQQYLPRRRMYEVHMKAHRLHKVVRKEIILKCMKCPQSFKSKAKLVEHRKWHDESREKYVCDKCGRKFTKRAYLNTHVLMHLDERRHSCPHCDYKAVQRSSLLVHLRKHTGERPFPCDLCSQRCISSSNLRVHRLRHMGTKQYECTLCPKKFGYKQSLEEHIAATHERVQSQSHTCTECGATYSRKAGLRRHVKAKHGTAKEKPHSKTDGASGQEFLIERVRVEREELLV